MRRLVAAAAIVMTAVLAVPQGATAQESGFVNDPGKEAEFVGLINSLRAEHGLTQLEIHGELVSKAREWARTMAEAGDIFHSNLPDGITVRWKKLGENVGMGGTVSSLNQAFIASPSHFENLVDPEFRQLGVGVFLDADGTIFVSEVFMELASQPAPATPASSAGTPNPSGERAQPISSVRGTSPAPEGERPRSAPAGDAAGVAGAEPSPRLVSVLDRLRALDGS